MGSLCLDSLRFQHPFFDPFCDPWLVHISCEFSLIWLPADALVKVLQSGTRSSAHPELELTLLVQPITYKDSVEACAGFLQANCEMYCTGIFPG